MTSSKFFTSQIGSHNPQLFPSSWRRFEVRFLPLLFTKSTELRDSKSTYATFVYQLIRVNARGLGENCKWLEMFEDVGMVIFCVSLSDYDQFSVDGNGSFSNKMLQTRSFFESMITHPTFEQMDFLLILNKFNVFEKKVEWIPLTQGD
ncbi:hypothetical protein ACLB2K_014348 [Fragaria x ananassa]